MAGVAITVEPIESIRETFGSERVVADVLVIGASAVDAERVRDSVPLWFIADPAHATHGAGTRGSLQRATGLLPSPYRLGVAARLRQPVGPLRGRRPAGWLMRAATCL